MDITNASGNKIPVTLKVDKRLKKTARWQSGPEGILLRLPPRFPRQDVPHLLAQIEKKLQREARRRQKRTDADLKQRADQLIRESFGKPVPYSSIRWVNTMQNRLGSCTNGGPTDGDIRLSDRMKDWPAWLVDYIIIHELAHRLHSDHSRAFWAEVRTAYPRTDEARGWVRGFFYALGKEPLSED
jgi:hypothetical protein